MKNITFVKTLSNFVFPLFTVTIVVFNSGCNSLDSNEKNSEVIVVDKKLQNIDTIATLPKRHEIFFVDLGSIKASIIKKYHSVEHKTFSKKGESDTLNLLAGFRSVLAADYEIKAKNNDEGDVILSRFQIFERNKLVFDRDSVLAVTAFEFDKSNGAFSFSVITDQNADTFQTSANLFLMDLKSGKTSCLKENLTNAVNSPFSEDGKCIYYLDNFALFRYNRLDGSTEKVVQFATVGVIIKIAEISSNTFNVIYLKDITDRTQYTTTVSLSEK